MRVPSLAVAAVLLSMPAGAQSVTVAKTQYEAWKDCVMAKAQRYAKGSDSAEVVARVAMPACKAERNKFWDQMIAENVELGARTTLQGMLENTLIEDASVLVMELRTRN